MGPFRIEKLVGPVACKLDLGTRLKGVHNVFHISLLQPYQTAGDGVSPPEPILASGIVSGLIQCGKWQAHVHFVVLDLTFDCVLGVPWLTMTNPRLDWVKRTLAV